MILTFFKGFWRELLRLLKDPRGLFMFLIAPLLLNIVVCGAFQKGIVNHIPLAAVDTVSSAKTRELIRAFDESDRFDVTAVLQDTEEAKRMLEAGEVEGIIVIPENYTRALQLGQQAEVLVGVNSANNLVGNSAVVSIMQVVKTVSTQIAVKSYVATGSSIAEGTAKVMPVSTVLRPWFNPQFSYLMYLGLGLTGLVYHQLFLMAVASAFGEEKKEGILTGTMPKRDCILHFFNKMIFYGVVGFLNILLNYAVIMKLFGFPMRGRQADLTLLCGCFVFCLLGFGALLGLLCKNTIHAMQWLMALTYPFFILSGFSWPHTEMPTALVQAANLLPATHFLSPVRDIVLMGIGFERASLAHSRNMLLLLGVIAFLLSLVVFFWKVQRAEKRQTMGEEVAEA
ncbi:ABC transporter permease [Anaerotignum sp.]